MKAWQLIRKCLIEKHVKLEAKMIDGYDGYLAMYSFYNNKISYDKEKLKQIMNKYKHKPWRKSVEPAITIFHEICHVYDRKFRTNYYYSSDINYRKSCSLVFSNEKRAKVVESILGRIFFRGWFKLDYGKYDIKRTLTKHDFRIIKQTIKKILKHAPFYYTLRANHIMNRAFHYYLRIEGSNK